MSQLSFIKHLYLSIAFFFHECYNLCIKIGLLCPIQVIMLYHTFHNYATELISVVWYISRMKGGAYMGINTAALNTVYNHYLTSYAPKSTTQFDTHKKSELRSIYNSIVKQNNEAPLCIVDTSKESQEFAINTKESARSLRNTIASLGGLDQAEMLNKKTAFSTNEGIATARFIGDSSNSDEVPSFDIEVKKLASPQVNTGNYLPSDQLGIKPDAYSFDISVNGLNYEFQFYINEGDTNKSVQQRLANLISNSGIGVEGECLEDGEGNSSLKLSSKASGASEDKSPLFQISDDKTSKNSGTVSYLGIADITRPAENAEFILNGSLRTASSNNFTIEKTYELSLQGLSSVEGETTSIGLNPDYESFTENVSHLVGGYNDFLKAAAFYLEKQPKGNRLVSEINNISSYYSQNLNTLGLSLQSDGTISLDKKQLIAATNSDHGSELLAPIKDFANSLIRKTNQVSLNPMNYVDKTIVAYKNPGHNFSNPYITSAYSGMMFNGYC